MNNKVFAKVGDKEITQADVNFVLNNVEPQARQQLNSEEGTKRIVDELINQELFYLDAVKSNLENDEEFKTQIERMKVDFLKQYYVGKLLSKAKVDDAEIFEFYNMNREMFVEQEKVSAKHILIDTEDEANKIIAEINAGKTFEDAAKEYSKCPSSNNGGELGAFAKGQMVPEFEKVAFAQEAGEMSGAVKTQFGYHIILTGEKTLPEITPYDKAKEMIRQHLTSQRQQDVYFTKVNQLKRIYDVTINE